VGTNLYPDYCLSTTLSHGTILFVYPDGPDVVISGKFLKAKGWVIYVAGKEAI